MNEKIQNFFLSCKECILENPRNFYGSFSLGSFKNSQSLTVANALRRTLLAEISGTAITHLEIEGVTHEYSTLVGVRESVLDLLLNFKGIVVKNTSPLTKPLFGYLHVRGPGIVRASDLKFPPMIQCVDPDQYIATLNENGKLVLKFRISDFVHSVHNSQKNLDESKSFLNLPNLQNFENRSFQNFESSKKETKFGQLKVGQKQISTFAFPHRQKTVGNAKRQKLNFQQQNSFGIEKNFRDLDKNKNETFVSSNRKTNSLWVDPLFNPILKVNYVIETIEPMQKNIPNEIVFIELWTNGSIHPRKAFYEALLYLKTMFDKLDCMRLLNYEFSTAILESEKTSTKFFKTFEYDFHVYNSLEDKKNGSLSPQKLFMPEEIEEVQKDYMIDFLNQSYKTWNDFPLTKLNFPYRITKLLATKNFFFVGDLLKVTPNELKKFHGIGNYCILIIQKRLEKLGLKLGSENFNP
uniref:alpha subunit of RNA polymerase n=1 Tax=Tetradesmus dimorphus TaxID=119574 RepID=UPI0030020601|nr:alpha subunit of RNA polymerase [Tetradesmus dimorphus]